MLFAPAGRGSETIAAQCGLLQFKRASAAVSVRPSARASCKIVSKHGFAPNSNGFGTGTTVLMDKPKNLQYFAEQLADALVFDRNDQNFKRKIELA